ncbi:MAG: RNA methyltransferase [Pirellulaceae bacterium]|nr:RNA methyltransferase [Pirellulaceae bacterium]
MSFPTITSLQNPRVKEAVKLRDRKGREQQGRILIEGVREIGRALDAGVQITEAFHCEPLCCAAPATELLLKLGQRKEFVLLPVSEQVMAKLSFGDREEGIVAIAQPPRKTLNDLAAALNRKAPPLFAVVEGVEKPGNLGAILRTADAAGVSGLIVASGGTDLFNPSVIRSSLGAIFSVPVCSVTSAEALAWLRSQKIKIFATRVDAALAYSDADLVAPCAVSLGSEARGLSPLWTGSDITPISLPMLGSVDSLNLSATAAILFYEALRQRKNAVPRHSKRG